MHLAPNDQGLGLYVDKLRLSEPEELALRSSVNNEYDAQKLQQAALIQDRTQQKGGTADHAHVWKTTDLALSRRSNKRLKLPSPSSKSIYDVPSLASKEGRYVEHCLLLPSG